MGTIQKKGRTNSVFIAVIYSLHFYFYERKQNKCVHVLYYGIITIKEGCCWLFFFKLSIQFNLILYSIN